MGTTTFGMKHQYSFKKIFKSGFQLEDSRILNVMNLLNSQSFDSVIVMFKVILIDAKTTIFIIG